MLQTQWVRQLGAVLVGAVVVSLINLWASPSTGNSPAP